MKTDLPQFVTLRWAFSHIAKTFGLSLDETCARAGLKTSKLTGFSSGVRKASREDQFRIAQFFQVSMAPSADRALWSRDNPFTFPWTVALISKSRSRYLQRETQREELNYAAQPVLENLFVEYMTANPTRRALLAMTPLGITSDHSGPMGTKVDGAFERPEPGIRDWDSNPRELMKEASDRFRAAYGGDALVAMLPARIHDRFRKLHPEGSTELGRAYGLAIDLFNKHQRVLHRHNDDLDGRDLEEPELRDYQADHLEQFKRARAHYLELCRAAIEAMDETENVVGEPGTSAAKDTYTPPDQLFQKDPPPNPDTDVDTRGP